MALRWRPRRSAGSRAANTHWACSRAFVPELVKRALPGFTLTHLQTPPPAISARPDTQYFLISKAGPCWDHMVQTKIAGVYVPGELPGVELELLVVLDS